MQFTSTFFITGLLPVFILLFYFFRKSKFARCALLLIADFAFYFVGGQNRQLSAACHVRGGMAVLQTVFQISQ